MHEDTYEAGWQSRVERERRDLSASVEASLNTEAMQEHPGREEFHQQGSPSYIVAGTALIPPRISLQSRPFSTVQANEFVERATSAHRSFSSPIEQPDHAGTYEQQLQQLAQQAQQVIFQYAYYGYGAPGSSSVPQVAHHEAPPPPVSSTFNPPVQSVRDFSRTGYAVVPVPFPIMEPVQSLPTQAGARRIAGRTTRIRLEVPQTKPGYSEGYSMPERRALPEQREEYVTHGPSLDLLLKSTTGATSTHLPVVDVVKNQAEAALNGSGVFEQGQAEAIIANQHITPTCVVQVMLSSDPGPVVVHYISLQPGSGFTVHLTAPASLLTSFNYVIVPSENSL